MKASPSRVVFDCNIFVQALINSIGPAGGCVQAVADGRAILIWSSSIIDEVRRTTAHPKLRARYKHLNDHAVNELLERVARVAVLMDGAPDVFIYPRDPTDAQYVNLAVYASAALIVSRDLDLLDLMTSAEPDCAKFRNQFPELRVLTPPVFLNSISAI